MTIAIFHIPHPCDATINVLLLVLSSHLTWPPVEPHSAQRLCDSNNHTQPVLPQGLAFVFVPRWSDTAVSSISLSGIMRRHRGQIVPPNLLAGGKDSYDESRFEFSSMNK